MKEKNFEERLKVVMDALKETLKNPSIKKSITDFIVLISEMNKNPETATTHLINYYRSIVPEEEFNRIIDASYEARKKVLDID